MIDDPEIPRVGVVPVGGDQARFCVWAPLAERVELVLGEGAHATRHAMEGEGRGFWSRTVALPTPDARYAYALDGGDPLPDPASRWQPGGVFGPSAVCHPDRFAWDEGGWKGIERADLVFYELHVGTFTPEGTFDAVIPRLPELKALGITAVEIMPVAQFPGEISWGYDGVFPFAVQGSYGGPEGLKRLVEACHRAGLAIFLDQIYNHFGPEGNVLPRFGPYLTEKYKTDWGPALNFDDKECDAVRAMVLDNVRMWIGDYRFDGLRLDAADQIFDRGPSPILAEIAAVAHREAARLGRQAHLFAETDLNDSPRFLREPAAGGYGLDGHWTDDFHHAIHNVLTGESNGYYEDFADGPEATAKVLTSIFRNDGCYSPFRRRRHGAKATEFSGDRFVAFTQNHDQVGNRAKSDRYAASLGPASVRLAAGLLLLAPRLPLLFMGQEYGDTNPFPFFSDFRDAGLVKAVREGRKNEFAYFGWEGEVPDPFDPATRGSAVLSWDWTDPVRAGLRSLHVDLLRLRRESAALRSFAHPEVRRSGMLLEMIRADAAGRSVRVAYNLGDAPIPIPDGLGGAIPSFRSEVTEYGATPGDPAALAPREFAILGVLRPATTPSL